MICNIYTTIISASLRNTFRALPREFFSFFNEREKEERRDIKKDRGEEKKGGEG
jgi:hypothetical protein